MDNKLDQLTDITINKIKNLLSPLDATTQATVVNLMAYTQYPIDGHDELTTILAALVSVAAHRANPDSDNPIAIAAYTLTCIWKIVVDQAYHYSQLAHINIEDAICVLTASILEDLQLTVVAA